MARGQFAWSPTKPVEVSRELATGQSALNSLGSIYEGMGNTFDKMLAGKKTRDTADLMAEINALGTPFERQQALEEAQRDGFNFLDMPQINEAMRATELHDFARIQRTEQAAQAADLLLTQKSQREDTIADNIARDKRNKQLGLNEVAQAARENEKITQKYRELDAADVEQELNKAKFEQKKLLDASTIKSADVTRDLNALKIDKEELEAEERERLESNQINISGQAQTYETILGLEGTRYEKGAAAAQLQESIIENRNNRVTDPEQQVLLDRLHRHIEDTETTIDATTGISWTNFGIAGRSKLVNKIYQNLLTKYTAADASKLKSYAELAVTNSVYNEQFNKAIAIENLPADKLIEHKNRLKLETFSKEMLDSAPNNYNKDYTTKRNTLVARQATQRQLKIFDDQFRNKALLNFTVDLTSAAAKKAVPFIDKNREDITRTDIKKLEAYINKIAKGPTGFKQLSKEEFTDIKARSILSGELSSKLTQAKLDLAANEKSAAKATDLKFQERFVKKEAALQASRRRISI